VFTLPCLKEKKLYEFDIVCRIFTWLEQNISLSLHYRPKEIFFSKSVNKSPICLKIKVFLLIDFSFHSARLCVVCFPRRSENHQSQRATSEYLRSTPSVFCFPEGLPISEVTPPPPSKYQSIKFPHRNLSLFNDAPLYSISRNDRHRL
jgi:hypothetical protein